MYPRLMRKLLLAFALSTIALAPACKKNDAAADKAADEAKIPSLTVDEVDQQVTAKQLQAVDVNGDATRKKMGVVPGAILLSDDESFKESELPADKTAKLVFYCANPG